MNLTTYNKLVQVLHEIFYSDSLHVYSTGLNRVEVSIKLNPDSASLFHLYFQREGYQCEEMDGVLTFK